MQDLYINRQIGDFLLQDLLEKRVSVSLYRATQQSLKRFVMFKLVNHKGIEDDPGELREDLEQYIHTVVGLEHLHLQPIYAYGVIDAEHIYIAGRFTSGTLFELLEAGALPTERALEMAKQMIEALAYIQSKGFVHRSLSPHVIYLDETGGAYINDLELAHIVKSARSINDLKKLIDEPFYISVEQLECAEVDFCSEVYNFGAVFYHMLTGVPPFKNGHDDSFEAVLRRKCHNDVVPPRSINPSVPVELQTLVLRLIRANPAERFPDISMVREPLMRMGQTLNITTPPEPLMSRVKAWVARIL